MPEDLRQALETGRLVRVDTLVRLYNAGRLCAGHPRALWSALGLSLLNHLLAVGCAWCMGRALGLGIAEVEGEPTGEVAKFLSHGLADWMRKRPHLRVKFVVPITRDGDTARDFASRCQIGMVAINVPIPVPLAYHTFGGWKRSHFGDLNQHGPDSIRFYTKTKTVTARWPSGIKEGAQFSIPTMR